ncbi:MAG: SxtJ family membrane protein [Halioglobus sp.]
MSAANKKMSNKELRNFGLVTGGMLVLFFDLLIPFIWDHSPPIWPLAVAAVLAIMALLMPASLGPVYKVWMRFAEVLGWINTRIILGVIFFLIFFPFGVILRLFNDPMQRKLDRKIESYRVPSNPTKPGNMERPF